ncbi:hypothetical protein C8J57DRAFT_1723982 [Mycena rebaudengoi]|nr:hypothetical protein C8J57DRAFT_1723982 [Mycena rebaudengoi]
MPFDDLVEDVVLRILGHCEILAALSLGQTNRYHHRLALQRTVWFSLLVNLQNRGLLDHTSISELHSLSASDLIKLAKTVQNGPITWSPQEDRVSASTPHITLRSRVRKLVWRWMKRATAPQRLPPPTAAKPEVSKQLVLHPAIPNGPGILTWENEAKLLRGGKYVLFNNWRSLQCWQVKEGTLLWTYTSTVPYASPYVFAAEVDSDGEGANIVVGLRTYVPNEMRQNFLEVLHLDLRSGVSHSLHVTPSPHTWIDNPFHDPKICGDIVVVGVLQDHSREITRNDWILTNWSRKTSFRLGSSNGPLLIDIIPGHIIFSMLITLGREAICVSTIDSLEQYWAGPHGAGTETPVNVQEIPILISEPIAPVRYQHLSDRVLATHESPVHRGAYRIWLYYTSDSKHAILLSYRLVVKEDRTLEFCQRSCRNTDRQLGWCFNITYSGHSLFSNGLNLRIIPPQPQAEHLMVETADAGDYMDVAAYSGALTYATHESVVISYFK